MYTYMKIQEITSKAKQHVLDNKKVWIISVIVLLCVLIITGVVVQKRNLRKAVKTVPGLAECAPGDKYSVYTGDPCPIIEEIIDGITPNTTDTSIAPVDATTAISDETAVKASSSYELARQEYRGKVLSYNDMCQATPAEITTTPDSVVMIANDSTKSHTFTLAGKTTSLVSYHYDLIYIGGANTYKVTCDGADAGSVVAK